MQVNEIFASIDGEVNAMCQGALTVFVRFQGCNFKCPYCDTVQSQPANTGTEMSVKKVLDKVGQYGLDKVTITGGEPLLQPELHDFICELSKAGYYISVETNGSQKPNEATFNLVDSWVYDWKLPTSHHASDMCLEAFDILRPSDWIKFCVASIGDWEHSLAVYSHLTSRGTQARFAWSPIDGGLLTPARLVALLLEKGMKKANLNIQLHKFLNMR